MIYKHQYKLNKCQIRWERSYWTQLRKLTTIRCYIQNAGKLIGKPETYCLQNNYRNL